MDYSIIIPVFNKAELTRNCLTTLRATLEGAGEGEVIVIDNASSDHTPEVLAEFPWAQIVRNQRNRGFAGANNQGAELARGRFLVLLNNDTEATPHWLAAMLRAASQPDVGVVGARLLFPDGTIQHAGVAMSAFQFGSAGFAPIHDLYQAPGNDRAAKMRTEYQVVTAACMVTPRDLYRELGGLDEAFWNGYEDVDYCLRVRAHGRRIVYEPDAVLTHFESQSGIQRFRRVVYNLALLAERWNGKITYDACKLQIPRGNIYRMVREPQGLFVASFRSAPPATIIVHGDGAMTEAFDQTVRANAAPIAGVAYVATAQAIARIREEMEVRGERYLAIVEARCRLEPGWLDELVRQCEFSPQVGASTLAPELPAAQDVASVVADGRCTLLSLRNIPQHLRLRDFDTVDGAIADLMLRSIPGYVGVRGGSVRAAQLPPCAHDAAFVAEYGREIASLLTTDPQPIEEYLRALPKPQRPLVSIVTLSWNAPEYTRMALDSIRRFTTDPYEVIIVDNGSDSRTTDWLKTLVDVRVIFNETNRGYAGGNNQGIQAAQGEYVVLLNNDVVVTEGWLDGLLEPFARSSRIGVTAPRSNRVAGHQVLLDAAYSDINGAHLYAEKRRERFSGISYFADRAIGLCLCIPRRVVDEVGGIDERYAVGNFEDDDFCLRVRAAGYRIYICEDVFIHHFGSRTFAANKIDYGKTLDDNWKRFSAKWNIHKSADGGYNATAAIGRGFDRSLHYAPIDGALSAAPSPKPSLDGTAYRSEFLGIVRNDRDWEETALFVRRYFQAFSVDDATLLRIAAVDEATAASIARRVERIAERLGMDAARVADVDVSDETDVEDWTSRSTAAVSLRIDGRGSSRYLSLEELGDDRSPSALRRSIEAIR